MGLLIFLLLGLVAGWLASILMRTNSAQGPVQDIVLGLLGAVIGGAIMNAFGQIGITGFNVYSILIATLGAIVLISLGRMVNRV